VEKRLKQQRMPLEDRLLIIKKKREEEEGEGI
jgi:hypothetical protein